MFQINETFLEGLGVENMDAEEKKNFLSYVQDEIETRIGERVAAEMSEEQEDDFADLIEGEEEDVKEVMMRYPHYADDELFATIKQSFNGDEKAAMAQYAMIKWLDENNINYQEIVKHVIDEVRREIFENKDQILSK